MIVSALLTSVGINLGLCILFVSLYSILRKQQGNVKVYVPRVVAEGSSQGKNSFNLENFLPTPGWVKKAWQPSEEELLFTAGLDAVVFMRIFTFSLRLFSFAGIVGIFILLPVNFMGDQLNDIDISDISNKSLDNFSISNVENGSKWLWIHFSAAYLITGVVCYLLYIEYKHISSLRLGYFHASKPQPHQFTILVRAIPISAGNSISDIVENFFTEYHPSTYLSHTIVRRTSKLRSLINDAESMYRQVTRIKSKHHSPQRSHHGGFREPFGKNVDPYEKKLEDSEQDVRRAQSNVSVTGEEVPAAFVCFRSRYGAATALHIQQSINPTHWVTEKASEPHDVYWPFFSTSVMRRWISKLLVILACAVLTVIFFIPVAFVQGLANLDKLEILFPFLKSILTITFVSQVITGYLPSLILQAFLSIVPPIMKLLSTVQGYISYSEIEKSACSKMLWFTIWNIFFANVLTGSVANQVEVIFDPKNIPWRLAVVVPGQASFFIAYVVTSWTSLTSELMRMFPLFGDFFRRHCSNSTDEEFHVPSFPYHSEIPKVLCFGLLGITYFLFAPLILPFLLVYFCLGYIIYRNQLLIVYLPKFETGGKFWPIVHNSTIFSLVLMQAILIGIFGLKKLRLASILTFPLPVLTLLFNEYCRKRFLPTFQAYSAESLIKKDREDQSDERMTEFYDKLGMAYNNPALMPIQYTHRRYSGSGDDLNSPFLPSAEA